MGEAVGLSERRKAWAEAGIALIGLGLARDAEECERFFKQSGERATYPLYRAPWVSKRYGVQAVPALLLFDPEGKEVFRAHALKNPDPLGALEAHLKTLLAAD